MSNKLLLGAGFWQWEGWTSLDADSEHQPDIVATVPPFPVSIRIKKWDEILCSHMIEHLSQPEAKDLLSECNKMLVEGGKLTLEFPDLSYCCAVYLGLIDPPDGKDRVQFGIQGIFGAQDGDKGNQHKFGYSEQDMYRLLIQVGFMPKNIKIRPGHYHEPVRDVLIEAWKGLDEAPNQDRNVWTDAELVAHYAKDDFGYKVKLAIEATHKELK